MTNDEFLILQRRLNPDLVDIIPPDECYVPTVNPCAFEFECGANYGVKIFGTSFIFNNKPAAQRFRYRFAEIIEAHLAGQKETIQ